MGEKRLVDNFLYSHRLSVCRSTAVVSVGEKRRRSKHCTSNFDTEREKLRSTRVTANKRLNRITIFPIFWTNSTNNTLDTYQIGCVYKSTKSVAFSPVVFFTERSCHAFITGKPKVFKYYSFKTTRGKLAMTKPLFKRQFKRKLPNVVWSCDSPNNPQLL